MKIETLKREDVAAMMGVSPAAIPSMIINGTLPVGCAYDIEGKTRTVIIIARWDKWIAGKDLDGNGIKI